MVRVAVFSAPIANTNDAPDANHLSLSSTTDQPGTNPLRQNRGHFPILTHMFPRGLGPHLESRLEDHRRLLPWLHFPRRHRLRCRGLILPPIPHHVARLAAGGKPIPKKNGLLEETSERTTVLSILTPQGQRRK